MAYNPNLPPVGQPMPGGPEVPMPPQPELLTKPTQDIRPTSSFAPATLPMEVQPETEASNPMGDRIESLDAERIDLLGKKALDEFSLAKSARMFQERLWVRLHQNEKGIYPANFDFSGGTCRAFVQLTRPKILNAHARLVDVLLPAGEDAWEIQPTPRPFVPEVLTKMLTEGAAAEDIKKAMFRTAEKASMAMKSKVKDGLAETNWPVKFQETLLHMCLYGTSVILGPYAVPARSTPGQARRSLSPELKGRLSALLTDPEAFQEFEDEERPEMEVFSPFYVYPDPGASTVEDCRYVIIKKPINKSQLFDLARTKQPGFRTDVIEDVISQHPSGDWVPEWWESELNVTNQQPQMSAPNDKFQLYMRWGWLSGYDLKDAGINVPESQLVDQVMCQMWVVSGRVIFLQPSELYRDRLPFYFTPYSMVPHCIWGAGPAEFMMDSQDGINACERMKYDNLALAGRPMAAVNVDRLAPGQDSLELYPGRVFATINSATGDAHKPVEWFMPPTILAQIQATQQATMALADEQTNLPRNLMGMGGEGIHNRTAQGASLQFNNAVTPLKGVAFNVDTRLITPLIQNMVNFYTKFSKDTTIIGDFKVIASGVSGLMAREVASQKAQAFLVAMSQNQDLAKRIDPKALAEIIMRGSGLYDKSIVFTESEIAAREQAVRDNQQIAQAAGAQLQAEIQNNAQIAMAKAQTKMRAETSPRDVLLETLQSVPDDCKILRLEMIRTTLNSTGLLTPMIDEVINYEAERESIVTTDQIKALASEDIKRELGPMEIVKMKHDERLAELKNNGRSNGSIKTNYQGA